ncbi:hypothetical protein [Streptacidiphilus sp. MAP12-20]|uniref:hypothetical protein n=1 Tax=Streptacidiphilus sp. MAP12-20 TaxID=3156299 RepID=UPI0035166C09
MVYASAAAALLALGAGGCFALTDNGPRLSGGSVISLGSPPSNTRAPFVREFISLCLDHPGAVSVTDVRPVKSEGGIAIQGFAVRPWAGGGSVGEPGTLTAAGYHPNGRQQVTITCSAGRAELAVQLERTGDGSATLDEIAVDYLSDGYRRTVDLTAQITLCALHDQVNPNCR